MIFVLLICFLRRGLIGGIDDLYQLAIGPRKKTEPVEDAPTADLTRKMSRMLQPPAPRSRRRLPPCPHDTAIDRTSGPILQAKGLTKRYGGLAPIVTSISSSTMANCAASSGPTAPARSTFFKMLTCEVPPTAGQILFEGRDITGATVTDVCQLGLTKSYQINQLFNRLTVRENITIAALATLRGKFRLDLFKSLKGVSGLDEQIEHTLALVGLVERGDTPVSGLAYGEKRRLEVGLALATSPSLLLLDEPLAGMSPRERVETVRLLKSIARDRTMIIIDHDMDFAIRTGRACHRSAGGPGAR